MTNSVMTSDLAINELQSNERRFGDDFDSNCNRNDLNSTLDTNDNHLTSTCGQQLSPIGSANSSLSSQHLSLSSPKNESKQQNSHSFNDLIKNINDLENNSNHLKKNIKCCSTKLSPTRIATDFSSAEDIQNKCLDRLSDNDINDNNQTNNKLFNLSSNNNSNNNCVKRVVLDDQTLMSLTVQEFRHHWNEQQLYINYIETQLKQLNRDKSDLISLRESEEKLKQQQLEANRRENVLVMRLTTKEQEMQEYLNQIRDLKQSQVPTNAQLQSTLIDPAINLMFDKMKKEVDSSRAKVEEMQNELNAWKFTPDSTTGKRLMSKCRLLYQENEELGKMIESGRIAKLEGELALQKNFSEELKKSQSELDDILLELDEDVEGMQNTIYFLQQQLKEAKDKLTKYEANHQNDKQCVQNSNETKTPNNNKVFERTFESSDIPHREGVHTINTTNNELNESNTDDEVVDCVNSTEELDSVEKTSNSVTNSEPTVRTVDSNEENSLNNNYLSSIVNKTTNKLNNDCMNTKRTSCFQSTADNSDIDDDDYKQPSVKVAKLNDNNCSAMTEDICGKQTNNSKDCGLSSSDSLTSNTLKTKCIEINGQSNE